jgi:hypothetical protein
MDRRLAHLGIVLVATALGACGGHREESSDSSDDVPARAAPTNDEGGSEHSQPAAPAGDDHAAFAGWTNAKRELALPASPVTELPEVGPCVVDSSPVYPPEDSGPGAYTVPVDAALVHVATNPVDRVMLRVDDEGLYHLGYALPRVLGGCSKHVDLIGGPNEHGELVLSGPAGTAVCTQNGNVTTCHEHLFGIVVNMAEVARALDDRSITGTDRADYLEVARRFSIDPLGVLTFTIVR